MFEKLVFSEESCWVVMFILEIYIGPFYYTFMVNSIDHSYLFHNPIQNPSHLEFEFVIIEKVFEKIA